MLGGWKLIAQGLALGLGAAAPIGPVNIEMARRVLRGGFRAGAALGLGAVSVDVFYLICSSVSVGHFLGRPVFRAGIGAAGVLLLGFLGIMSLRSAIAALRSHRSVDQRLDLGENEADIRLVRAAPVRKRSPRAPRNRSLSVAARTRRRDGLGPMAVGHA